MAKMKLIKPDIRFIQEIMRRGGGSLKRCFQCANCTAKCGVAPDDRPFPRKEMIMAQWGLRSDLLTSVDIWLCQNCADCTAYCPRGAKPSEVLSALRRLAIVHYASPKFFADWLQRPQTLFVLIPILSLILGLFTLFGSNPQDKLIFSSTPLFSHYALKLLFGSVFLFLILSISVSSLSFWRAITERMGEPKIGVIESVVLAVNTIVTHKKLSQCIESKWRFYAHILIFFGFFALFVSSIWVITAPFNPLLQGFIYPFNLFSPQKVLGNLGGLALLFGSLWAIKERLCSEDRGTYFDWLFLFTLLITTATGFSAEILHYFRADILRYPVYFVHLLSALFLLIMLPYSKFAHILYRTLALIISERYGR
jgi:quinone-modifying oxidoreductase subunit QmoC